MMIEDQLRERLKKVEALYFGSTSAGERGAAGAAADRLRAKLDEAARSDPPVEMKFTLPDEWSVRLFVALCRRYGVRPFRYPRQRRTTIMVRAPRRFFDTVVWRQFSDLHMDLWIYFEQTTERLRVDLLGHAGRGNGERAEPVALTADQAADLPCSRAAFQFHARSSASWLLVVAPETMRSSTSASHVSGSTPLSFAV